MREPLSDRMVGRWQGILPALGVDSGYLRNKHGPCPICGAGRDRFRFDDKNGKGTWYCSHCGAGDGISLLMKLHGWDFKTTAQRIESVAGDVVRREVKPKVDGAKQLAAMKRAWGNANIIGSAVRKYLVSRGIDPDGVADLRQNSRYEMLALVRGVDGNGCQVHRTLLTKEGCKIDGEQSRLFMPGPIPKGSAVRLLSHDDALGIAEGIETALSASILHDIPCWAALNAQMLKAWEAPEVVKHVVIFGDNDANCTGQAAAFELARRLSSKVQVSVQIPEQSGVDWNDILLRN